MIESLTVGATSKCVWFVEMGDVSVSLEIRIKFNQGNFTNKGNLSSNLDLLREPIM